MQTRIHTTKKLEPFFKKFITNDTSAETGILGKWNATIFFVERKKCLLFTNGLTKYNVILTEVKSSDLSNIEVLFKNSFISQLIYDGIIVDFDRLTMNMGQLAFLPTDNDRSTTGFQNQRLYELEVWKEEFRTLDNMPMTELASRMNRIPIHIGKSKKFADFTTSTQEMKKVLSHF
jgi:hypothetical protein